MAGNKMNINKVIDLLKGMEAESSNQFRMNVWVSNIEDGCGTMACLAGWGHIAMLKDRGIERNHHLNLCEVADWYGLDDKNRRKLFNMYDAKVSTETFDLAYEHDVRAKIGIKVLEIFRDEGVVDWDRAIREVEDRIRNREDRRSGGGLGMVLWRIGDGNEG